MAEEWNPKALDAQFRARAEDARLYLDQCRTRARTNRSYEHLHDETYAKYQAHDYFVSRSFLESRQALLRELRSIRDRNHTPSDTFDAETYQRAWRHEIDQLISRFSGDVVES